MTTYTSPPISVTPPRATVSRADIELDGVEHGGLSYEARVFLNNPNAGPETPATAENGYAGSFYVYGFGTQTTASQPSGADPPVPMRRSLTATEAVQRLLAKTSTLVVTVVPVLPESIARSVGDVLKIQNVAIHVA